ncbi:MAG TPA: RnfABCDGE type electron transport complex subunit D [Firmicutes bacterium]|nr:RnfABCDGE type electron transport complex subunit D [Bacillota bacterium]
MLETEVVVSPSPHIRAGYNAEGIMWVVVLALVPASVAAVYYFGWPTLTIILASIAAAVLTEAVVVTIMKRPLTIYDGSAVVTGLLLALTLPPTVPVWIPVAGSIFAIIFGKQIYGGLGYNPFNPALIGRAFLLASWPTFMVNWVWPEGALGWAKAEALAGATMEAAGTAADAVAGATALGLWRQGITGIPYLQLYFGNIAGSLGETSALAILLGGLFLLIVKIIDWRIPFTYLGTVLLLAFLMGEDPLFHLLAGGLLFGAFFMATDYVTTPVTPWGRVFFGFGCGLLTMLIRKFGGFPEGVCYSILLMNITTPLLDRWTAPKRFGEVKANG